MAIISTLALDFTSTQSCDGKTLYIYDNTGTSSVAGDEKWDDPSGVALADIVKVTFTITDPSDDDYVITVYDTTVVPNVTDWVPSTAVPAGTPASITYDDMGGTSDTVIPDGIYIISYTVYTATDQVIPVKKYELLLSEVTCCVYAMFAEIDYCDCRTECDCYTGEVNKALRAWSYYKALKFSGIYGNTGRINRLLTIVQKLCNYSGTCVSCN